MTFVCYYMLKQNTIIFHKIRFEFILNKIYFSRFICKKGEIKETVLKM